MGIQFYNYNININIYDYSPCIKLRRQRVVCCWILAFFNIKIFFEKNIWTFLLIKYAVMLIKCLVGNDNLFWGISNLFYFIFRFIINIIIVYCTFNIFNLFGINFNFWLNISFGFLGIFIKGGIPKGLVRSWNGINSFLLFGCVLVNNSQTLASRSPLRHFLLSTLRKISNRLLFYRNVKLVRRLRAI